MPHHIHLINDYAIRLTEGTLKLLTALNRPIPDPRDIHANILFDLISLN